MKKITFIILFTFGISQNSLYVSKSMFTDIKAHDIGDVITVLIAEISNASRESTASISASSGMGADGGVTGNLYLHAVWHVGTATAILYGVIYL